MLRLAAIGAACAAFWAPHAHAEWRAAGKAPGASARAMIADANVRPAGWDDASTADAPGESGRSIVVKRDGQSAALAPPTPTFDPFEQFKGEDAAMPATEPVAAPAPGEPGFDPFEEAEPMESLAPSEAASEPATDDAASEDDTTADDGAAEVEEPATAASEVPAGQRNAADELEKARGAIDREIMRREIERGAADELPKPGAADEIVPDSGMEAEVVPPESEAEPAPADETDDQSSDSELDEEDWLTQPGGQPAPPLTAEDIERRRKQIEEERIRNEEKCEELYQAVRNDSIKDISLEIRPKGNPGEDFPFECSGRDHPFQPRSWAQITYLWKASGLCHKPLYFEQVQLERYGHDWGPVLQPVMSGAHFFGTLPILPYKMGIQTPCECVYTLGYYRPGSCAPYAIEPLPFTWRAAAFQAGAVTGVAAAVP